MPHGRPAQPELLIADPVYAQAAADAMQALATPSRLRILASLRERDASVNELAASIGMESSAVSHQLRLLRHKGFVVGRRDGRRIVYALYDEHVAEMLEHVVAHLEHVRLGLSGPSRMLDATRA